ncbi:MAG: DUF6434 domain-containing protein [Deltaproteobacteria bacterium]|jgi:hypothetical protein
MNEARPELSARLSEAELLRWYWTMAELQPFARSLGVSASGPKAALTARIAARLGGRPAPAPEPNARPRSAITSPTLASPILARQRSTQTLRRFFEEQIGAAFKFDGHMRAFLRDPPPGATLSDAVEHWHATRGTELPAQSESLEFNRFTKAWHAAHPGGTAAQARAAWERHRALPVDRRPPIEDV